MSHQSSTPPPVPPSAYARLAFFAVLAVVFTFSGIALTVTPSSPDERWGGGIFVGLFLLALGFMTGTLAVISLRAIRPLPHRRSRPIGATAVIVLSIVLVVAGVFLGLAGPPIGWVIAVFGLVAAVWQARNMLARRR